MEGTDLLGSTLRDFGMCMHKSPQSTRRRLNRAFKACHASQNKHTSSPPTRRECLLSGSASVLALHLAHPALANAESSVVLTAPDKEFEASSSDSVDTTITDRVFLDVGMCPEGLRQNRTLGDKFAYCSDAQRLGRLVIGLYGRQVPNTVRNFLELVKGGALNNTVFSKVLPGQYLEAGRQGSPRMGQVAVQSLPPNEDLMAAKSYNLRHRSPGTVSLNLSQNSDDPILRRSGRYTNTSFFITTGPGPATELDGTNIVFGRVLEGIDTIGAVTKVPIFKPVNDRLLALNRLGSMLGDERAEKTRKKWGTPLKAVLIVDSGVLA